MKHAALLVSVPVFILAIMPFAAATPGHCSTASAWTTDGGSSYTTTITPANWLSAKIVQFFSDDFIKVYVNGNNVFNEDSDCDGWDDDNPENHYGSLDIPLSFTNGVSFTIRTDSICPCGCTFHNAAVQYQYTYCADMDGDGYDSSAFGGTDCNDGNAAVHPGATEICSDGVDNNCNGPIDCADPACSSTTGCNGYCATDSDCSQDFKTCDGSALTSHDVYCDAASHKCKETTTASDCFIAPVTIGCVRWPSFTSPGPLLKSTAGVCNSTSFACGTAEALECSVGTCGAQCDTTHPCTDFISGSTRYYNGVCSPNTCNCSYNQQFIDNIPPVVLVNAVPSQPSSTSMASFYANSSDNVGVVWTRIFIDGVKACEQSGTVCTVITGPYRTGPHLYYATAIDAAGNTGTSGVQTLNVFQSPPQDTIPPFVDISHFPSSPSMLDNVSFTATASDGESGLSRIRIFVDGINVKNCTSTVCLFQNGTYISGIHAYYAEAYDVAGNRGVSAIKQFTVPSGITPPPIQPVSSCGVQITGGDAQGSKINFTIANTGFYAETISSLVYVNNGLVYNTSSVIQAGSSASFNVDFNFGTDNYNPFTVQIVAHADCGSNHTLTIVHWAFNQYTCSNPPGTETQNLCDYKNAQYLTCTNGQWVAGLQSDFCGKCPYHCGDGICSCAESYSSCSADCQFSCTEGYVDSYSCNGNVLQRQYKYSNCTVVWVPQRLCPNGCYNNACMNDTTPHCGVQIRSFDYVSQVVNDTLTYVTVSSRNTGDAPTRINTSVWLDGSLKSFSYQDVIQGADFTTKLSFQSGSKGTHSILVKSKAGCGAEDSRVSSITTISSGDPYVPPYYPPAPTPVPRLTAVYFYPSFIDTVPLTARIIGVSIVTSRPQTFAISAAGLPAGWIEYANTVSVDTEKTAYVYITPQATGNYTIAISARAMTENLVFNATVPLYVTNEEATASFLSGLLNELKEWAKFLVERPLLLIALMLAALIVVLLIGHRHLKRDRWPL